MLKLWLLHLFSMDYLTFAFPCTDSDEPDHRDVLHLKPPNKKDLEIARKKRYFKVFQDSEFLEIDTLYPKHCLWIYFIISFLIPSCRLKELRTGTLLKELGIYLLFLFCLSTVVYKTKNPMSFQINKTMRDLLVEQKDTGVNFGQVNAKTRKESCWKWSGSVDGILLWPCQPKFCVFRSRILVICWLGQTRHSSRSYFSLPTIRNSPQEKAQTWYSVIFTSSALCDFIKQWTTRVSTILLSTPSGCRHLVEWLLFYSIFNNSRPNIARRSAWLKPQCRCKKHAFCTNSKMVE